MLVGPGGLDSSPLPLPSSPESLTACHAHENAYAFGKCMCIMSERECK